MSNSKRLRRHLLKKELAQIALETSLKKQQREEQWKSQLLQTDDETLDESAVTDAGTSGNTSFESDLLDTSLSVVDQKNDIAKC